VDIIVSELEKLNELGEMRGWLNSYEIVFISLYIILFSSDDETNIGTT
jgi:hypothetical protein